MGYVNYSPWTDAANYGRGIGDVLSQALLQLPQQRAEVAMQKERFPLEQQLLNAQIDATKFRPQYQNDLLSLKQQQEEGKLDQGQQGLDIKKLQLALQQLLVPSEVDRNTAEANKDSKWQPAQLSQVKQQQTTKTPTEAGTDAEVRRALELQKSLAAGYPGGANQVPSLSVADWAVHNANPTNGLADLLMSIRSPNLQTNQPGMLMGMLGAKPEVTTNGAQFNIPASAAPASVLPPTQPNSAGTQMVRVKNASGQTGSIPAGQLQQALSEGYSVIQ